MWSTKLAIKEMAKEKKEESEKRNRNKFAKKKRKSVSHARKTKTLFMLNHSRLLGPCGDAANSS